MEDLDVICDVFIYVVYGFAGSFCSVITDFSQTTYSPPLFDASVGASDYFTLCICLSQVLNNGFQKKKLFKAMLL